MTYFANGTEGMILDEQCSECLIGIDNYCPIAYIQMMWNYDQICSEGRFKGYVAPIIKGIMETLIENSECRMKGCIDDSIKRREVGDVKDQFKLI